MNTKQFIWATKKAKDPVYSDAQRFGYMSEKKLNAKTTTATSMTAMATTNTTKKLTITTTKNQQRLFVFLWVSEWVRCPFSFTLVHHVSLWASCSTSPFRKQWLSFGFSLELHKIANCFLSFYSMLLLRLASSMFVLLTPLLSFRWPVYAWARMYFG